MNEKLTFPGGEPNINFDDLNRNNKANKNALISALRAYGDNYIIQGVTGTTSITAGYVMLDGEILQVDAHTKTGTHFVKVTTYDSAGDKIFNDLTPRQTWAKHRATITAGSGSLAYSGAARLGDVIATLLRATSSAAATTALAGIVEKATTAEAQSGTAEKYLDAALLQLVTATETRKGVQENATTAEAKAMASSSLTITPSTLADVNGGLLTKIVNIGDWDMDSTSLKVVPHGISNFKNIRALDVIVRNDADTIYYKLDRQGAGTDIFNYGGISDIDATDVKLYRTGVTSGNPFDSTDFNSTSYNRGWITIWYIP